MIILLFFAVMLFIASAASVYENDLMIRGYVTVNNSVVTKLVLGRLPFMGGQEPAGEQKTLYRCRHSALLRQRAVHRVLRLYGADP